MNKVQKLAILNLFNRALLEDRQYDERRVGKLLKFFGKSNSSRQIVQYRVCGIFWQVFGTPGRPGEFHPKSPTEPYVKVSFHTALLILTGFNL